MLKRALFIACLLTHAHLYAQDYHKEVLDETLTAYEFTNGWTTLERTDLMTDDKGYLAMITNPLKSATLYISCNLIKPNNIPNVKIKLLDSGSYLSGRLTAKYRFDKKPPQIIVIDLDEKIVEFQFADSSAIWAFITELEQADKFAFSVHDGKREQAMVIPITGSLKPLEMALKDCPRPQ